jgi:Family of unknown function (DUF6370)
MKKLIFAFFITVFGLTAHAQTAKTTTEPKKIKKQIVEIACGECQFKMSGKGCDLAIRIDGTPYFVDGRKIDDYGDAHGDQGFCNAISKAEVTGEIANNRFQAKSVKLIAQKESIKPKTQP